MKTVVFSSIFAFLSVTFLTFVNLGCSSRGLETNPETVTAAKLQDSLFTVIETEDVEYPTLAASGDDYACVLAVPKESQR